MKGKTKERGNCHTYRGQTAQNQAPEALAFLLFLGIGCLRLRLRIGGRLIFRVGGIHSLLCGSEDGIVGNQRLLIQGCDLAVSRPCRFHHCPVIPGHTFGNGADGRNGRQGGIVRRIGAVDHQIKVLAVNIGFVILSVDRTDHGKLLIHIAHIVYEVGTVEYIGIHAVGGVPHIEGNQTHTGNDDFIALIILIGAEITGTGHMLQRFIVGAVKFLFQNGGIVAGEDHLLQLVTAVEGLMAHSRHRIGQGHHLHIAAGKGQGGNPHRAVCHPEVLAAFPGIGDQFQAVYSLAIQGTVDHLHGITQDESAGQLAAVLRLRDLRLRDLRLCDLRLGPLSGLGLGGLGLSPLSGLGLGGLGLSPLGDLSLGRFRCVGSLLLGCFRRFGSFGGLRFRHIGSFRLCRCSRLVSGGGLLGNLHAEGCHTAHGEGVIAQLGQLRAQLHSHVGDLCLHKGMGADLLGTGQIHIRQAGVGKGIVTDLLGTAQILHLRQALTVGEGTLAHMDTRRIQGHILQRLAVNKGILANFRGLGQIHRTQLFGLNEGIFAHSGHIFQIDIFQADTAGEGIGRNLRHFGIQHHIHQLPAVGEGILADLGQAGQIQALNIGAVMGVDVLTFLADSGHSHAVVQANIVNVTGEGIIPDLHSPAQVDIPETVAVVEGHIADLGSVAQGDRFQAGMAGKYILADGHIVANGQLHKLGGKGVVEVTLAVLIVMGYGKGGVLVHVEGIVLQHRIVAHSHRFQFHTLTECTLADSSAVGNMNGGQLGVGEGILLDHRITGHLGKLGNGGFEEGILTDVRQLTQGHRLDTGGRTHAVSTDPGNTGQLHIADPGVVGERALADGSYLGSADGGLGEVALQGGADSHQGGAVSAEDVAGSAGLVSGIAPIDHKFLHCGIPEGEGSDILHIGANGDGLQTGALIEHTLGQNSGIHIEALQGFAVGEGIGAVLDLCRGNGHRFQLLTAGKGVVTHRKQGITGDDLLQTLVAGKGIGRDHADGRKIHSTLQVAALEGGLVDHLQVILTAEGDLLQRSASVESTVFDEFQGGGKHDLLQGCQIGEGIGTDLLDTLGQDNLGNGVVTDVPLLGGLRIVKGQLLLGLEDVLKVREGEVADLGHIQV